MMLARIEFLAGRKRNRLGWIKEDILAVPITPKYLVCPGVGRMIHHIVFSFYETNAEPINQEELFGHHINYALAEDKMDLIPDYK